MISIVQKLGRITGTARSDIFTRRVYCTQEVYDNYKNYIANQNSIHDKLLEYQYSTPSQILENIDAEPLTRRLDRRAMKSVNDSYKRAVNTDSSINTDSSSDYQSSDYQSSSDENELVYH